MSINEYWVSGYEYDQRVKSATDFIEKVQAYSAEDAVYQVKLKRGDLTGQRVNVRGVGPVQVMVDAFANA